MFEALFLIFDMVCLMLVLIWSARHDQYGSKLTGKDLFDYTDGAECDDCPPVTAKSIWRNSDPR